MQIVNKNNFPPHSQLALSIGFFDGVHLGHRFLIEQVKKEAAANGLQSAVVTFPVHPRQVLQSDYCPALLCGYEEKLKYLSETDIDYCIELDFTTEIAQLSAQDFITQILVEQFKAKVLIIGYDHRFGRNREQGFEEYSKYGNEVGLKVVQAKEYSLSNHISSSCIRQLLGKGEIRKANQMLSYRYTISGKIIEGFKVGRTIGFPTANIQVWEQYKVIPALGVYAVYVQIKNCQYEGMLYIGKRPTLQNGNEISLEVNIFNFDEDLYNKSLTVQFVDFVRSDKKFESLKKLKGQIVQDKQKVIEILKNETKLRLS